MRALIVFNNVRKCRPDRPRHHRHGRLSVAVARLPARRSDGRARDAEGKVIDPHGTGIRGYVVNNCHNISFQDLLLLRSAYWTVTCHGTENFSTRNIKIVNRKQQYHDDAYDFGSSNHILIENGFAMTMDDTFAFYGGRPDRARQGHRRPGGERLRELHLHFRPGHRVRRRPGLKHLRFEDVHFVTTIISSPSGFNLRPRILRARGIPRAPSRAKQALGRFRFVNCTFENDGGHIYIDGGDLPLTNFVLRTALSTKRRNPD